MYETHKPSTAMLATALLVVLGSGCSSMVKGRSTNISSDPAGATVTASGVEIGTTPMEVVPDEIFPPRFVGFEYRAAGTLAVQKTGCEPFRVQVDDGTLAQDLHVELDCDPAAVAASELSPKPAPDQHGAPAGITARLETLETLRRRGLVSDVEYERLRQQILERLVR